MQRDTVMAGVQHRINITRMQQQHQQHGYLQHGVGTNRPDISTTADARDQEQQGLVQLELDVPITYMPFKFENRRVRIDWRLLHGVDVDKLVGSTLQQHAQHFAYRNPDHAGAVAINCAFHGNDWTFFLLQKPLALHLQLVMVTAQRLCCGSLPHR
jgi:hypothetical protein